MYACGRHDCEIMLGLYKKLSSIEQMVVLVRDLMQIVDGLV